MPALMMPIIILGGIYGGIMTPTEAAGVAVVYAIPIGFFFYRGLTLATFYESLKESAVTIGVVMVMIFMVLIVSRFMIFEDIPGLAEDLIYSISENRIVIILMINLVMLLIGMLMDDISGIILSASLLLPIAEGVGIDPIHFAAIVGVNLGMGNITPPTAPLLYLGAQVTNVSVRDLIGPTMIFIIFAWFPTLIITTFIPEIALFLPELLLGH
jgi:C4-dicarboxylate transporter DctM subunit